jgi:HEAT repeat protein
MSQQWPLGKKGWIGGLAVLAILGAVVAAWIERESWWLRYAVYRLTRCDGADRDVWIERVIQHEDAGRPALLACLSQNDSRTCANVQDALERLVGRWPAADERRVQLTDQLAEGFARFSSPGRHAALSLAVLLMNAKAGEAVPAGSFSPSISRLLMQTAQQTDADLRARGLALAEGVLRPSASAEALTACRELTQACLRDGSPESRVRAIQLAGQPSLKLLEQVPPLLHDPAPEVRRAALLAVGPAPEILATDDLLPWLHDPDPGVRRLCENALQGRGLRDEHIQLGRLLTAAEAQTRLKVLKCLRETPELEPGIWLRRLSQDPSAAVRAAALRAATEFPDVNLADRMQQVVQDDPSPTVRQIAAFYLSRRDNLK